MECHNCTVRQRQFYCTTCIKTHLRDFHSQHTHYQNDLKLVIAGASNSLANVVEPARMARARVADIQGRVEELVGGLSGVRRDCERKRDRIRKLREDLAQRRRTLGAARMILRPPTSTSTSNTPTPTQAPTTESNTNTGGSNNVFSPLLAYATGLVTPLTSGTTNPFLSTPTYPPPPGSPDLGTPASPTIAHLQQQHPYPFHHHHQHPASPHYPASPHSHYHSHYHSHAALSLLSTPIPPSPAFQSLSQTLVRARVGLIQELVEVFNIVEVGGRPNIGGRQGTRGEWTIGPGLVLPVPGDIRRYPPLPSNGPSPVPGDTDAKSTQAKTDSQPPVQTAQPTLTLQPTLPSVPRMQSQPVEGPSIPSGLSSVPNASSTSGTSADIDFRTSAKSMTLMGPHNNVVRSQTVPIVSQLPRQPPVGSMLPPPVPVPKSTQSLTQPNARGLPTSVLAQTSGPRPSQPPVQPNVGRPTQVTLVAPAQEPPPKENENAMQIDKPPVPPPAPPVAKIPPEQIFGHSDIPRITLLGFEKGKKERGTIPFKFKLSSIQVDLLQKWKKQAGTLEELACTVSVSLGCYLIESLKPPSSFLEQIAIMPSTFAQDGGLSMRFEGVGSPPESVTLPLSPPFLSTPDGRFDLSSLICKPGPHSFEIIQSRDWSQYAFVLFLHHPTASQMKKAEERKRKDREWEEWKARVSKPPLMTVPKLKVG